MSELYGNPLSLRLLGEACAAGEAIPETRSAILALACEAMLVERNDAHKGSSAALAQPGQLLDAAGAGFAGLLLTGNVGIYTGAYSDTPQLYLPQADVLGLVSADALASAMQTRLFRGDGENRFIPLHRVVAEYLGARWLAKVIDNGISPRRVLQLLRFQGGVPSSLRGLHAWICHFSSKVADDVIATDPYGIMRYGDGDALTVSQARLLLSALTSLVEDDPYFRAEDWAERRVRALDNPALRNDIVAILRQPKRPYHLSTLILNAIAGSSMAQLIREDLELILLDQSLHYGERFAASDSLITSKASTNWDALLWKLLTHGCLDSARLAVEIIRNLKGNEISIDVIAEAALQNTGILFCDKDSRDVERNHVVGTSYLLSKALDNNVLETFLDALALYASLLFENAHWETQIEVRELVETALHRIPSLRNALEGSKVWSWIRFLDRGPSDTSERAKQISSLFATNPALRCPTSGIHRCFD